LTPARHSGCTQLPPHFRMLKFGDFAFEIASIEPVGWVGLDDHRSSCNHRRFRPCSNLLQRAHFRAAPVFFFFAPPPVRGRRKVHRRRASSRSWPRRTGRPGSVNFVQAAPRAGCRGPASVDSCRGSLYMLRMRAETTFPPTTLSLAAWPSCTIKPCDGLPPGRRRGGFQADPRSRSCRSGAYSLQLGARQQRPSKRSSSPARRPSSHCAHHFGVAAVFGRHN